MLLNVLMRQFATVQGERRVQVLCDCTEQVTPIEQRSTKAGALVPMWSSTSGTCCDMIQDDYRFVWWLFVVIALVRRSFDLLALVRSATRAEAREIHP